MGLKESNNRSYSSMCWYRLSLPSFLRSVVGWRRSPCAESFAFARASSAAAGNVHLGFEDDFELVVDDKGDGD